ncbi:MAG: MtrB/PioB family outer membrane beta-barrel protein, partial [Desulfobacteraceae bacterium]|nr:MtrB/PioB family outer membrane beta-barrel protein [Desulfobacteraceae bacterium]
LTSRPMHSVDTRLYYNYLDKANDSTVITTIEPSGDVATNSDTLFGYRKNDAGIDVGFHLPLESKAEAGYEYRAIDRSNRPIVEKTTDNTVHVQLINRSLDFMTGKIRYEHLFRDTDSGEIVPPGTTAADADFFRLFLGRFDAIDKDEDKAELDLSFFLLPNVDLGFEYRWKKNDYKDTIIGRTNDKRHEFYGDILWRLPRQSTLSAFAGYEIIKLDSTHYSWNSANSSADPLVNDGNPASFLWTQDTDDDFWTYGISVRTPIVPKVLDAALSWRQDRSDGEVDFTTQGPTPLIDIGNSDDYDLKLLEATLIYALAPKTDITLGYIYERFKYNDLKLDNYQYTPAQAYLSGVYTDLDYNANIGYLLLSYKF